MNIFRKHIPGFVDVEHKPEDTFEFETAKDLLEGLKAISIYGNPQSLDDIRINGHLILWISEDGSKWWVLGRVKNPVDGIKKWEQGKR